MTTVKIRHEHDIEARYLADVPFCDLDTIIPALTKWGLNAGGDDCTDFYAQFCYEPDGAFFEIIVAAEADE